MYKQNRLAPVLPLESEPLESALLESAPLESEPLEPASLESTLPQELPPRELPPQEPAWNDKALAALDEFMSLRSNLDTFSARMADGTLIGRLVARLPEDEAAKAINLVTEWINQELRKTAPETKPKPAPAAQVAISAQVAMEELTYDNSPESPEEAVCY